MAREPGKQARFEVLLEQVRKELELVAEGYVALDQKIDRRADELGQRIDSVDQKIDRVAEGLSKKMDVGFAEVREAVRVIAQRLKDHEHAHT